MGSKYPVLTTPRHRAASLTCIDFTWAVTFQELSYRWRL